MKTIEIVNCRQCPFFWNGSIACGFPTVDWTFVGKDEPPSWCPIRNGYQFRLTTKTRKRIKEREKENDPKA